MHTWMGGLVMLATCVLSAGCRTNGEPSFGGRNDGRCEAGWSCGEDSEELSVRVAPNGSCGCLINGEPASAVRDASICEVIATKI